MPSETASAWWGERQREGRRGGGYEGVSFKKNLPFNEREEEEESLCGQRASQNTDGSPTSSPPLHPFLAKHHGLFLSSDNHPRGQAPPGAVVGYILQLSISEKPLVTGKVELGPQNVQRSQPACRYTGQCGVPPARARGKPEMSPRTYSP